MRIVLGIMFFSEVIFMEGGLMVRLGDEGIFSSDVGILFW
jgi:hypothetical protein